jgi:hypothetical protein
MQVFSPGKHGAMPSRALRGDYSFVFCNYRCSSDSTFQTRVRLSPETSRISSIVFVMISTLALFLLSVVLFTEGIRLITTQPRNAASPHLLSTHHTPNSSTRARQNKKVNSSVKSTDCISSKFLHYLYFPSCTLPIQIFSLPLCVT